MTTSEDTEIHIARRDLLTLAGAAGGLVLTGQDWGAADAYRMGLVQEVTAPGQSHSGRLQALASTVKNAAQPIAIPFRQSDVMLRHLQSLPTLQYYPVWFRLCRLRIMVPSLELW
jgi:enoyl-CoA hydratase/carnithine racemase